MILTKGCSKPAVCSVLLFLVLLTGTALAAHRKLPVLVYHHLEDPVNSDVSCTPAQFRAQMEALLRAGFTPIRLQETRLFLVGGLQKVLKPVLITFDDGYASLHQHALPVARDLQIPMVVFLVTARIGRKPQFTRYLAETEIQEMIKSGCFEFGSHSHDLHTDVLRIYGAFPQHPNPFLAQMENDLNQSFRTLRHVCGENPVALAWPYGKFNRELQTIARKAGFVLHFTSTFGYNESGSGPLHIKRIPVSSRDTPKSVIRKAQGAIR